MERDMTKGSPLPVILRFTLPLIIGNIFRCVHEMQQRPHGDHAEECQDNREKESQ